MRARLVQWAALLLTLATTSAAPARAATVAPPATPAGRALAVWLDGFDRQDQKQLELWCTRYFPHDTPAALMSFRRHVGSVELTELLRDEPLRLEAVLRERQSGNLALLQLEVRADDKPPLVAHFGLRRVPPGLTPRQMKVPVDAATRARVLDGIDRQLTRYYIDAALAAKVVQALRAHQKHGDYDRLDDGDRFAQQLTEDLEAVAHDGHMHVWSEPKPVPPDDDHFDDRSIDEDEKRELRRQNCAVEKVEHLAGNIGYIKIDGVPPPEACAETTAAALALVAHSDGLLLDLRDNHGGDPAMVTLWLSYLLPARTHVNDLWERFSGKTYQYWTQVMPGASLLKQPIFVLTSHETFSGGEEMTYDLQSLKRATIVGETTGGGAHPAMPRRLDTHFAMTVPFARPINPVTKRDWEGTGVIPDVAVPAAQALDKALELLRAKLKR